jgi:hypothetical protein
MPKYYTSGVFSTTFFYLIVSFLIEQLTSIINTEALFLIQFKVDPFIWLKQTYLDFCFYRKYLSKLVEQIDKINSTQKTKSSPKTSNNKWNNFMP